MEVNSTPKVAVLLAAYNGKEWIKEQVDSIFAQRNVDVSLFISVDLSSDGTDLWVRELAEESDKVQFLPYGDRFGGAGANFYRLMRDVDFNGFDYVSFSDQDDIWLEGKLDRACTLISSNICDVYSSDVIAFWNDGKRQLIKKSYPQREYDCFFEAAGPGCTYVFNSRSALAFQQLIKQTIDLSERVVLHDWLAYAFCRSNGFNWYIDDEPLMLYRQHGNNQVGINEGIYAYKKRLDFIRMHWYRNQVKNISELVDPLMSKKVGSYFFRVRYANSLRRRFRDRLALFLMSALGVF